MHVISLSLFKVPRTVTAGHVEPTVSSGPLEPCEIQPYFSLLLIERGKVNYSCVLDWLRFCCFRRGKNPSWQSAWEKHTKENVGWPLFRLFNHIPSLKLTEYGRTSPTGHCNLEKHKNAVGWALATMCPKSSVEDETPNHHVSLQLTVVSSQHEQSSLTHCWADAS